MTKKCLYCGNEISTECIIDFCDKCGVNVFGKKMLDAIKQNMENAKMNGDLCHHTESAGNPVEDNFNKFD